MKKSILETNILQSDLLYAHSRKANTKKTDSHRHHKMMEVYEWRIETEIGNFSGTCLSINDLNKEIALLTKNVKILKKNIIPIAIMNDHLDNKIYTWNVITNFGHASGVSLSLEEANRVIDSFGSKEVIQFNIMETSTKK